MVRPKKQRNIEINPDLNLFIPYGKTSKEIKKIILELDELEALRLTNIEELSQEETAERMGVSRQLIGLMLSSARKKITEALLNGMAIRINTNDN